MCEGVKREGGGGGGVVLMVADGRQMDPSELVGAYSAGMVSQLCLTSWTQDEI